MKRQKLAECNHSSLCFPMVAATSCITVMDQIPSKQGLQKSSSLKRLFARYLVTAREVDDNSPCSWSGPSHCLSPSPRCPHSPTQPVPLNPANTSADCEVVTHNCSGFLVPSLPAVPLSSQPVAPSLLSGCCVFCVYSHSCPQGLQWSTYFLILSGSSSHPPSVQNCCHRGHNAPDFGCLKPERGLPTS